MPARTWSFSSSSRSHDLGVADDEAEPPAGHAVGLRQREELDADLLRTRLGEEARRPPPVEDEVAVGEVVQYDRSGALRVGDRLRECPLGHRGRDRVRRVVQIDRRDVVGRSVEVRPRLDRQRLEPRARQRDGGEVVRIAGVGEEDRRAALGDAEREVDERRLDPRHDRDLPRRV